MKLSVIIVNYNVRYFLEQALLSVRKAAMEMGKEHSDWYTEICVVDNNSVDDSLEMLQVRFPEVKVIANKHNPGFSVANNQAIEKSQAEYILLLNPDTVVQEDTFLKTVAFMEAHTDAGGLGVKMLDGRGDFLPESKRGFPSPAVAFFKIFGFSKLFPKTKLFGRYHLGFLSKEATNEVDVLAGAFMLLRKKTLDEIGLLDETFFMYGEDIDLSYRIVKAGYKNYYFPETRIIHYKGESTKKSSVNYVFVFYKAMIIFAKKHFSKNKAFLFSILLNMAIWLRMGMSVIARLFTRMSLPIVDFALLYTALFALVGYWERTIKYIDGGKYPPVLYEFFLPLYVILWMAGLLISGAYRKPFQFRRTFRGVVIGSLAISIGYAFLSENYRYSRAIIVLGAFAAIVVFFVNRLILKLIKENSIAIGSDEAKKIIIVGKADEAERVISLLDKTHINYNLIGFVSANDSDLNSSGYLGNIESLAVITKIYKAGEIIFCARDVSSIQIIQWMEVMHGLTEFKIVPEDSQFVIGSNSKDKPGDYYSYQIELAILKPENKLNKRLFDLSSAILLLITLPLNFWFIKNKGGYIGNLFNVLIGNKTWVSYSYSQNSIMKLPELKKGVLSPSDEIKLQPLDDATLTRLDYIYAKDYDIYKDLSIFVNGFSRLGK